MKNLYKIEDELYIISDAEDINENDYIVTTDNRLVQVSYLLSKDLEGASKVILTTNKLLIKEGVQAIDDEFLNWFVKNPSCEEVEVEKTYVTNSGLGYREYAVLDSNFKVIEINANISQTSYYLGKITALYPYEYDINYKIIIPKEEHKQGSIVEAVKEVIGNQLQQVEELRQETQGYICPQTKKQCDDECCVSAEHCHIEASFGIISDCEQPKQETLEDYVLDSDEHNNLKSSDGTYLNFYRQSELLLKGAKLGAKWQQEQNKKLYSGEDMIEFADFYYQYKELIKLNNWETIEVSKEDVFKKWIEQLITL